ncbi:MAG: thrombospondin type 3 repeat-containing protein [Planctomycetota bacterium]
MADFTPTTDTDADGMYDIAEFGWFDSLSETGTGDHDGDGWSNAQEMARGTDPTDPNSYPVTRAKGSSGGGCGTGAPMAGLLAMLGLAVVSRRRQED